MSVLICNRFHATQDKCDKMTTFLEGGGGSRLWRPPAPASLNLGGRVRRGQVLPLSLSVRPPMKLPNDEATDQNARGLKINPVGINKALQNL